MAMRRRRRGFGGFRRRRGNRPRWTAEFANLDPAAGALASQIILSELDFGTSTTLESECLLHRIILSGDVICAVAGIATVGVGICMLDESVTPTFAVRYDVNLVDSLVDDDWLWHESFHPLNTGAANEPRLWYHVSKDIRVKRKLKSTDQLRLVVSNAAGGVAITTDWTARLLVTPRL